MSRKINDKINDTGYFFIKPEKILSVTYLVTLPLIEINHQIYSLNWSHLNIIC